MKEKIKQNNTTKQEGLRWEREEKSEEVGKEKIEELLEEKKSFTFTSRDKKIIFIAIIILIASYLLDVPTNATIGYHFLSIIAPLISYSVILMLMSALISGIMRKFKTLTIPLFAWLFLSATIFNLVTAVYKMISIDRLNVLLGI